MKRHCEKMADEPASLERGEKVGFFTASGLVGEAREVAKVEGDPAAPA